MGTTYAQYYNELDEVFLTGDNDFYDDDCYSCDCDEFFCIGGDSDNDLTIDEDLEDPCSYYDSCGVCEGTDDCYDTDDSSDSSPCPEQTLEEKRSLFDAVMGTLGGALEAVAGILGEPVTLGTSTVLIIDGSYRVLANGADVVAIIGEYDFDIPNNIGGLLGYAIDYFSGNDSGQSETVLGLVNDAYTFVATGGTIGNAKALAAAVSEGSIIGGTTSIASYAVFINDLDNLKELMHGDCP